MIKHFYKKLILLLICIFPTFSYASFTISPVRLKINKDQKIAALTIKNGSNDVKNFQLISYKVDNISGKESETETKDLMITPVMFKILPGKTQLIRVAIKNKMYNTKENGYTISVKELPHKMNKEGAYIQLVTEFKLPLSIEPEKADK